jgi:hypothetical protein
MPGVTDAALPNGLNDGGIFLLRSAAISGTATVSGTANTQRAGTADLRNVIGPYGMVVFEVAGTPTGSARIFMLAEPGGWPSALITSLVRTAAGVTTALLTGRYSYVVADLRGVNGVTANLHLSWS